MAIPGLSPGQCLMAPGPYTAWNLLADPATTTTFQGGASTTHPVANLYDGDTSKPARFASDAADRYFTSDLGSARTVSLISIHNHNLGTGITRIEVWHSTTGAFGGEQVLFVKAAVLHKKAAMYLYIPGGISRRYWRVIFIGTNGSAIWLGEATLCNPLVLLASPLPGMATDHDESHARYETGTGRKFSFARTSWETRYVSAAFLGTIEARDQVVEDVYRAARGDLHQLLFVPRAPGVHTTDGSGLQVFDGNEKVVILGNLDPPKLREEPKGPALIAWSIGVQESPAPEPLA